MKVAVKSLNAIAKTLDENNSCIHTYVGKAMSGDHIANSEVFFSEEMQEMCSTIIEVGRLPDGRYRSGNWFWHPDWLELV